jgi:hypothetical protein
MQRIRRIRRIRQIRRPVSPRLRRLSMATGARRRSTTLAADPSGEIGIALAHRP